MSGSPLEQPGLGKLFGATLRTIFQVLPMFRSNYPRESRKAVRPQQLRSRRLICRGGCEDVVPGVLDGSLDDSGGEGTGMLNGHRLGDYGHLN